MIVAHAVSELLNLNPGRQDWAPTDLMLETQVSEFIADFEMCKFLLEKLK